MPKQKTLQHGVPVPQNNADLESNKEIIAIMPPKDTSPSDLSDVAKYIRAQMAQSTYLVTPWPSNIVTLVQFDGTIHALDLANVARKSNIKGSAKAVTTAVKGVRSDMSNMMSFVQNTMRANRLIAETICTDCGFEHKKITIRGPVENSAEPSTEAGVLIVQFTGGGQYHIQMSSDGGITWVNCDPTKRAGVVVRNLKSKTPYLFRGRKVLAYDAYGDWVGPVEGTPL